MGTPLFEALAGVLLLFFLPGLGLVLAVFPEWRLHGPGSARTVLEAITLSFVLSVALTVLVGYLLLQAAPGGFQAYWTDPVLEVSLAAVAAVGFAVGAVRRAFPQGTEAPVPPSRGEEGAWELDRRLEHLGRRERSLERAIARGRVSDDRLPEARRELRALRSESEHLRREREDEYVA